jgi:hypothetical protein
MSENVKETTDGTFENDVLKSDRPVWSISGRPGAHRVACWRQRSKPWPTNTRALRASSN